MKKSHKIMLGAAAATAVAGTAGVALATQEGPAARITMEDARLIALEVAPGQIDEEEYENEDGAWRYSFDIAENGRIHEIGVDANSGEVVENSWEDADDEADEADEDEENEADGKD